MAKLTSHHNSKTNNRMDGWIFSYVYDFKWVSNSRFNFLNQGIMLLIYSHHFLIPNGISKFYFNGLKNSYTFQNQSWIKILGAEPGITVNISYKLNCTWFQISKDKFSSSSLSSNYQLRLIVNLFVDKEHGKSSRGP